MPSESDPDPDYALQQDILSGRKFSLADAIGREGSGFLKGESTVPKLVQAKTEVMVFIRNHLPDGSGALQSVLQDIVQADDARISAYVDCPLYALRDAVQDVLSHRERLYELVRQVDMRWGHMYGERPYFQKPGQDPHPEDEYTHESVQVMLEHLLDALHRTI
ncbi:MAG: hypothetical protein IGR76_08105 [Synechococcales cyanobacterium T60_A2020_003]|nr:hypothetical protein [Synechococcales cyanobacterium T60_A2020_003]